MNEGRGAGHSCLWSLILCSLLTACLPNDNYTWSRTWAPACTGLMPTKVGSIHSSIAIRHVLLHQVTVNVDRWIVKHCFAICPRIQGAPPIISIPSALEPHFSSTAFTYHSNELLKPHLVKLSHALQENSPFDPVFWSGVQHSIMILVR